MKRPRENSSADLAWTFQGLSACFGFRLQLSLTLASRVNYAFTCNGTRLDKFSRSEQVKLEALVNLKLFPDVFGDLLLLAKTHLINTPLPWGVRSSTDGVNPLSGFREQRSTLKWEKPRKRFELLFTRPHATEAGC